MHTLFSRSQTLLFTPHRISPDLGGTSNIYSIRLVHYSGSVSGQVSVNWTMFSSVVELAVVVEHKRRTGTDGPDRTVTKIEYIFSNFLSIPTLTNPVQ